ncbi:MAG TPA: hypothetical protein VIT38_04665, partial [Allosphingosinicella sp.]
MRRSFPLTILLLATVASCAQPPDRNQDRGSGESAAPRTGYEPASDAAAPAAPVAAEASGAQSRAAAGGPNVGPTAAPGVAFNYHYAFRLAAPRIAQVQEEHAQMCERLTIARCRITGLLYRYIDERNIEARLELKLDPAI